MDGNEKQDKTDHKEERPNIEKEMHDEFSDNESYVCQLDVISQTNESEIDVKIDVKSNKNSSKNLKKKIYSEDGSKSSKKDSNYY